MAGVEDGVAVPLVEQIACVERELHLRRNVYPRWVKQGKLTQAAADTELRRMQGVLDTLRGLVAP